MTIESGSIAASGAEMAKKPPPPLDFSHLLYSWLDMGPAGWRFLQDRLEGEVKSDAPQRFERILLDGIRRR